jgi:hypothetical protein
MRYILSVLLTVSAFAQTPTAPFDRSFNGDVNNENKTSSGSAWADIDGDGDLDVFVSAYLNENNLLYENVDGELKLMKSGPVVNDAGLSSGATFGDYDNDGFPDLFVANQQGQDNFLYRNLGGKGFERVTSSPIATDQGDSYSAAWADFDNDGFLDLYVANMGRSKDFMYRNKRDGTFERVRNEMTEQSFSTFSAAPADFDNDGDMDLFLAEFGFATPNSLWKNNGDGTFERIKDSPIVTDEGMSMGASWGDPDNDGDLDLYVTNGFFFQGGEQNCQYYKNNGNGTFTKVTLGPLVSEVNGHATSSWADYDNDGDLDLWVSVYRGRSLLFRNEGNDQWTKITEGTPIGFIGYRDSSSWGDVDRDGDLDLLVTHWEGQNDLLFTNQGNANHWLYVKLAGTKSNRMGVGARIVAETTIGGQKVRQFRQILTNTGARGQSAPEAHFGLGDATKIEKLTVHWPSGATQELTGLDADRIITVREGEGVIASMKATVKPPLETNPLGVLTEAWQKGGLEEVRRVYAAMPAARADLMITPPYLANQLAISENPPTADELAAIAQLQTVRFPAAADAAFNAAEFLRGQGRMEEAKRLYQRALDLEPKDTAVAKGDRAHLVATAKRYLKKR